VSKKSRRPTSLDIARLAEVSQATVSRALRNSPLVRPETRARVQAIAQELHYRIDHSAAGLRTGRSHTLALLLFEESPNQAQINPFFLSMLGHITRAAAVRHLDLLVSFQQLSDDWYTDYEACNRADGMILLGYGDYLTAMPRLRRLAESHTNFVIWGPVVEGMPGHYLCCDNAAGALQATQHLLKLGRRGIAYAGSASDHWPEFKLRHTGYVQALREAGIEPDIRLQVEAESNADAGYQAGIKLLDSGPRLDAVFAASDLIAIGIIGALRDRGISVPGDVAVVGFDDIAMAAYFNPPLTTVHQDTLQAGAMLVDNVIRLIEGESVESKLIAPRLIVRASCGSGTSRH
jgi:DNA-binding LacI/PurR family transcriptional regulator